MSQKKNTVAPGSLQKTVEPVKTVKPVEPVKTVCYKMVIGSNLLIKINKD